MLFLALLSIPFGLFCLWPLARRYVLPEPEHRILALLAGMGLSVGGLTLWMLLLGLLPGKMLSAGTILIFPAAMWVAGVLASPLDRWRVSGREKAHDGRGGDALSILNTAVPSSGKGGWGVRWLWLAMIVSLAVSLIHSLYYPFVGEDEISRYAYYARLVFEARSIPPAVNGYPLLLPLGYAWAFFLSGGPPAGEHIAKIVSWVFAPATIGATYYLTALWAGKRAGIVAAFTLAVTRLFVDWSPMGYVDIPTGLYYALTGTFVSLWWQRRETRYAWLSGAMIGLAMWTKQAGFAALPSAGLVFVVGAATGRDRRREVWRQAALALGAAALIALPWYARNVALGGWGNAVPGPGPFYYQQARRSALDWIPFLAWTKDFGYGVALLYLGGSAASVAMLWPKRLRVASVKASGAVGRSVIGPRRRVTDSPGATENASSRRITLRDGVLVQWIFILPYLALWWNWFSYDPRFLLTVLPFYAALVGLAFEWAAARLELRPRPFLAAAVAGALLVGGTYSRLGGVYQLTIAPFASDADKLLHYKPDLASTVNFLRQTAAPGRDRIYSMDSRLAYYLTDYAVTTGYPTQLAQLEGYQYLVAGSWAFSDVYPRLGQPDNEVVTHLENPQVFELLYTSELGTVKVYRVLLDQR